MANIEFFARNLRGGWNGKTAFKWRLLFLAGWVGSAAGPAMAAAPIVRHTNPAPAIILDGVTIPAGAEMLLLSGQVASPIDQTLPGDTRSFGDTRTQAINIFTKIDTSLRKAGYRMSDVVKLTVFIVGDSKLDGKMDFAGFNSAYQAFFGTQENPNLVARSTVQVAGLANPGFLIEIEAIAAKAAMQ